MNETVFIIEGLAKEMIFQEKRFGFLLFSGEISLVDSAVKISSAFVREFSRWNSISSGEVPWFFPSLTRFFLRLAVPLFPF